MFGLKGKANTIVFLMGLILVSSVPGMAADYPTKPISLIIPFGPGGTTDLTGRALFNAAKGTLGQPVIAENKAGGGGTVGINFIMNKPPDGYTLAILPCVAVMTAYHMGKFNFNPVDDLTHIFRYTSYQNGLVVQADSPWKTFRDFIKYVKDNPQKVSCGTPGVGSASHLIMEDFQMLAGNLQMVHIPYKGDAETNTALLGGHVDCVLSSTSWAPFVDSGKFRLLVVFTSQRLERYPQVPTLKECGYDMAYSSPLIVVGPKGMSKPIVRQLHNILKEAAENSEYLATLKKLDLPLIYMPVEDLEPTARKESEAIGKIVRKLGMSKKP
jgi:tripartite-type tricarboxylate transporter receptor subunit TctC